MRYKLDNIMQAVTSIQSGLLRFTNEEGQQTFQVKLTSGTDNFIHCVIAGEVPHKIKIKNKSIHLIQKHHDDYFFISGHVDSEVKHNLRVLSIAVSKASWFVRKRRGSVTWFSEKYTYENGAAA